MPINNLHRLPGYLKDLFAFQDGDGIMKVLIIGVSATVSYVFPTQILRDTAIAAFSLIALDTMTGLAAAFIEKRKRSSLAFSRVLVKSFGYLAVCIVASVVEKTILRGSGFAVQIGILWLIIATEGVSILENTQRISGHRFKLLQTILGNIIDQDEEDAKKAKRKKEDADA
jgi:phage-related holin